MAIIKARKVEAGGPAVQVIFGYTVVLRPACATGDPLSPNQKAKANG